MITTGLILLALLFSPCDSEDSPGDELQRVAEELSRRVWGKWNNSSLSIYLEAEQNLTNEGVVEVNVSAIAEEVAANLSQTLSLFRCLLNETASFAESLYSSHRDQDCCSSVCQYGTEYNKDLCSMSCNRSSIRYISSGRGFGIGIETGQNGTQHCVMGSWGREVCMAPEQLEVGESAVHIPRDVHEEDPSVLCFVQWTEELTQSFSSNEISLSNLTSLNSSLTQYVGTDSRLLRFYPPSDWSALSQCNRCPLTLQDTFELGRRPWYTNTVTGDKFIVVLLDVSGSMAGFQSLLARTTISHILRALTSNDFFLIIQVGEGERTKSVGHFSEKTQATPENVLVASQDIMLLLDTNNFGRAYFSQPLQKYLWLLGNSTECHRLLIIFSDGERETPLPADLVRRSNQNLQVQIFTFLIGGGSDCANMEQVACQNRGRMGRIREYYDIIPAVLPITDSLTLPTSPHVHYTTYRSIFGNLALSMGHPLWEANETFGIVGFDIPHKEILNNALQTHRIGASGYAFLVDNNGQLVNHPAISEEFVEGLSDDSLLSLDIDYFEFPTNSTQWAGLREKILSGGHGQSSIATWALVKRDKNLFVLRNTTYSFAPITDTPFMVVLVTSADLWVSESQYERSEVKLSPLGGRGKCEGGRSHQCEELQRVEGCLGPPSHHLQVFLTGGVCGNESSVAILRSLEVGGHAVGVVSHTLSPVAVKEMLTEIVEEGNERDGEETEIYLLDESANIIAAYPNNQRGWFPAVYPEQADEILNGSFFERVVVRGYEPRPRGREGGGGVCEDGEAEEEGEWVCESGGCGAVTLYVREIEIYQLRESGGERVKGSINNCSNSTLSYVVESVPNTSLTLVKISGPCLRGNNSCSRQAIRYRCQCGLSEEKFRASSGDTHCPNTRDYTMTSFCSAGLRPHPSLPISIVIFFMTWLSSLSQHG